MSDRHSRPLSRGRDGRADTPAGSDAAGSAGHLRTAIEQSIFAELSAEARARVLVGAQLRELPIGIIGRPLEGSSAVVPPLALIIHGRVRYSMRFPDGRRMALNYSGAGDLIGVSQVAIADDRRPDLFDGQVVVPATLVEATEPTTILELSVAGVVGAARTEPAVGWALAKEIARQAGNTQRLMATNVAFSIRARVARHLLNLAVDEDGHTLVKANQQDLADAVGSVREVVSRAISQFIAEGHVVRVGRTLEIVNLGNMLLIARGSAL